MRGWIWLVCVVACNDVPTEPKAAPKTQPKPVGKEHAEIKGTIRHAHAGGARVVEAGDKGELDPIHAMWGASPTDIYAAAWDDPGHGLLHSKGDGVWTHDPLADRRLLGVWGASAHDIYVTGNEPVVYHGHGDGKWTAEKTGARGATGALWGSGPHDIYAVAAYGEVFHSTGDGKWTKQSIGDDTLLMAIWGSGPGDLYIGGDGTWKKQAELSKYGQIRALWGASATDIYATGEGLYHSAGDGKWAKVEVEGLGDATGLWGDDKGTLYVGGTEGKLYVRKDGAWTHTADKNGGEYQALWGIGDELYLGAERFLTWRD